MEKQVFIIAEAGVNHNGSMEVAKKMIEKAAEAGVDAIKFQTFVSKNLVSKFAKKAEYQMKNMSDESNSQLDMLNKLELSPSDFAYLKEYCKEHNIMFLSTPFDMESIDVLRDLDINMWKIPSGEITNLPYIIKIAKLNQPIIMSTGMCNIEDIEKTLQVIRKYNSQPITILHCNTEYPTPLEDVNLKAMLTLKNLFNTEVGYSDHTVGIDVPLAAVAMGASMIEKHFTLDKNMDGPDHLASLEPDELIQMVKSIRNIERAIGDGKKTISPSERKNIEIARKSIVAARPISKGEIFSEQNLTTKRPGNGLSPMEWFNVLGIPAKRDFTEDELIEI
ncbi:N-acetylneuraminate synthase [Paenibacillus sp. 1011MAR3C5]|uniref:N-acetylneuraminate synthase n=1 Tax=Paenibacillus sp. 1011MAR3C5 TaxID=1675787 RepID=UPI000E6C191E|nr:N-acetylneuraminate synthase [Paenibacillus sp. 1011MAR3C5]RJE85658.1 N-acetylneuraminate synthase [Paenibacillus sp. 1011MAR3C5]